MLATMCFLKAPQRLDVSLDACVCMCVCVCVCDIYVCMSLYARVSVVQAVPP